MELTKEQLIKLVQYATGKIHSSFTWEDEAEDVVDNYLEAINYTHSCTELLCVDKHIATYLTEGKKYKLLFEDENKYYLKNDDDEVFGYNKIYFEVVKT